MARTIEGLDGMGPEKKKKSVEELAALNAKIGYPDSGGLQQHQVNRDSFWNNQEAAVRWNVIYDTGI